MSPTRLHLVFSVLYFALTALLPATAVRVSAMPEEGVDIAEIQRRARCSCSFRCLQRWLRWASGNQAGTIRVGLSGA